MDINELKEKYYSSMIEREETTEDGVEIIVYESLLTNTKFTLDGRADLYFKFGTDSVFDFLDYLQKELNKEEEEFNGE